MAEYHLNAPLSDEDVLKLKLGDIVYISGNAFTCRSRLQKHIFDSVDKRKSRLNYSNQKIKTLLKITDEEYAALDPDRVRREREERFERKIARNERDEEIISLYQHGVAKKEIARRFDISKKTVQRKIRPYFMGRIFFEKMAQCSFL